MNDPSRLEDQLRELGEHLKQGSDLTPRVMAEVRRIAMDPPGQTPSSIRHWVPRWALALALAAMVLIGVTAWLMPVGSPASVAFAEVQAALRRIETAVVVYDFPEVSWFNHTLVYRHDSDVVRTEWPSGIVELRDVKQARQLILDPRQKTARSNAAPRQLALLSMPDKFESPRQLLDRLASIEAMAVEELGQRELEGELIGFGLPRNKAVFGGRMQGRIWVDPQSRLPVRYELLSDDPDNLALRYWRYSASFTFDRPLDAALFELTTPAGYQMTTEPAEPPYLNQFAQPPRDEKLASPTIEPNVGIGPARFSMTAEQVIAALGRPDGVNEYWEPSPEEQRETAARSRQAAAEADEKGLKGRERAVYISQAIRRSRSQAPAGPAAGMSLDYHSRGFTLMVSKNKGLTRIFCYGPGSHMRPFTGKTSKGIAIGATAGQIEDAYGPADIKKSGGLYYRSLHLLFDLRNDQLWEISLDKP